MSSDNANIVALEADRDKRRVDMFIGPLPTWEQFIHARGVDEVLTAWIHYARTKELGIEDED